MLTVLFYVGHGLKLNVSGGQHTDKILVGYIISTSARTEKGNLAIFTSTDLLGLDLSSVCIIVQSWLKFIAYKVLQ